MTTRPALDAFTAQPGILYPESWWDAVYALYEQAFPGLPAGIRRAAAAGVRWAEVTTPFALFEGARCVCHVGVISYPMCLYGQVYSVAGIHAVCTAPSHRGRGLARQMLTAALAWADHGHRLARLHTDDPPIYTGHGFRVLPTVRYRSGPGPAARTPARRLDPWTVPADATLLARLLAARSPPSTRCAVLDPGWLPTINAALHPRLRDGLWHLPEHDAILGVDAGGSLPRVGELIAATPPPLDALRVVLGEGPVEWSFDPGRWDPAAVVEPVPPSWGSMMVRGPWPAGEPLGVAVLWEH